MKNLIFSIVNIFLLFCLVNICDAKTELQLKWKQDWSGFTYYIQNKGDEDVTITGYKINRGNMLSTQQEFSKDYKFKPETLKFGDSTLLFTITKKPIEVEVFTDKGSVKFDIDR